MKNYRVLKVIKMPAIFLLMVLFLSSCAHQSHKIPMQIALDTKQFSDVKIARSPALKNLNSLEEIEAKMSQLDSENDLLVLSVEDMEALDRFSFNFASLKRLVILNTQIMSVETDALYSKANKMVDHYQFDKNVFIALHFLQTYPEHFSLFYLDDFIAAVLKIRKQKKFDENFQFVIITPEKLSPENAVEWQSLVERLPPRFQLFTNE